MCDIAPPPAGAVAAIVAAQTEIETRVDLWDVQDGAENLWVRTVDLADGSVSIDDSRDERRMLDLVIHDTTHGLTHSPDSLWYDKIVRPYRGVAWVEDGVRQTWLAPLGVFMIDQIESRHLPAGFTIRGTDYTKKLLRDKFSASVTFTRGQDIGTFLRNIAINGGVEPGGIIIQFPDGMPTITTKDYTFDKGTTRWQAIKDIATSCSCDVFFCAYGILHIRPYRDPDSSPLIYTFATGPAGTLTEWTKTTSDSRIYNHIVVYGDTPSTGGLPVWAEAENHNPDSPTSIENLNSRVTYEYTSSFITTTEQAQAVADKFLKLHSLEEYDLGLGSLVLPWLDVSEIIGFEPEDRAADEPTRFLLSSAGIPLNLGTMSLSGKRVISVG